MKEVDDKLVKDFFSEHKQEIKDNGFSRRVRRNLPDRSLNISRNLVIACRVITITLFFVLGGLQAVGNAIRETFVSMMQYGTENIDIKSLLIGATVLLFFGVRSIITAD